MKFDKERGFKYLMPVDKALNKLLSILSPVDYETIPVSKALGRVPIEDIISPSDQPPFNRAAMDGYAVNSLYVSGASDLNPIRLKIVGEAKTAKPYEGELGEYEAVRIDTGAPLPKDADAVVMIEDTIRRGEYIEVFKAVSPYSNVSLKGEDIKTGDVVSYGNTPLNSLDIAALISSGIRELNVYRKVSLSIASIGNELKEFPSNIRLGELWETNRLMVLGLVNWLPIEIKRSLLIPDDKNIIIDFFEESSKDSDLIVTTGGTSLGKGDLITDISTDLGDVLVHGVALQPSKPVLIALVKSKPYIGLPGYPVATAISTRVFLIPALMKLAGIKGKLLYPIIKARLTRRVASKLGFKQFVRVKIFSDKDGYLAEPTWASGAGVLSSLSRADGYLIIPENVEGYEEGDIVEIHLYRNVVNLKYEEDL